MANLQNTKANTMAVINSAITILDKMPALDQTSTIYSYNESSNPFEFLIDIFKSTTGYDELINIISKFIAIGLPALEAAVKAVLLSNIKNLLNCAINPIISDELLMDGVVFDLKQIDVMGMLYYCPLDDTHIGQRYYFGCDGFEYPYQLERAGDFNAFLWFEKNMGINRSVWYGVDPLKALVYDSTFTNSVSYIEQKQELQDPPIPTYADGRKCEKGHGLLTLDYHERPISLRNAIGGERFMQTPYGNCIQVFIGNVRPEIEIPKDDDGRTAADIAHTVSDNKKRIDELTDEIVELNTEIEDNQTRWENDKITRTEYEANYKNLSQEKNKRVNELNELISVNSDLSSKQRALETEYYNRVVNARPNWYRALSQNYYYRRTLIEFNTDYVMSLKLFDSKVVTAQLLDALTGCLSMDLNLSIEQLIIKNEVEKMVKSVIETDDAVISDCFFTFSNEQYDNLVHKAEMIRAGLFTIDGEENGTYSIDPQTILNSIDAISGAASKEEVQTIIAGSLKEISATLSEGGTETTQNNFNFNVKVHFIENILNNLAYVITSAIVSPKLYLLFEVNLKILGLQTNFSLSDFIDMHRKMIVDCIRSIRDQILAYIVKELMKIIGDLAEQLALAYAIEQAEYYRELIRNLIECFRRNRGILDFNIDNVDYADIYQEDLGEPSNNNC